jgi:hypothetical protein
MGILAWRLRSLFRAPPDGAGVEAPEATEDFLPPDTETDPDPEWNELLSWAQVTPDSGALALAPETPAEVTPVEVKPLPPPEVTPPPAAPSEADEWAAVIARVKALQPAATPRGPGDQPPLRPLRPVKPPLWASPVAARLERLVATKTRIDQQQAAAAAADAEEDEWRALIARAKTGTEGSA